MQQVHLQRYSTSGNGNKLECGKIRINLRKKYLSEGDHTLDQVTEVVEESILFCGDTENLTGSVSKQLDTNGSTLSRAGWLLEVPCLLTT